MKYVTIKQLAFDLGMDRSHARRFVAKSGVKAIKRRDPGSNNQLVLTVTEAEAARVIDARHALGYNQSKPTQDPDQGWFYVIQLVPDLDPRRIKMGFTNSIDARMAQHSTAAPTLKLTVYWPCRRAWEVAFMDCLRNVQCDHIRNEVFTCHNLDALIETGNRLSVVLNNNTITTWNQNHLS